MVCGNGGRSIREGRNDLNILEEHNMEFIWEMLHAQTKSESKWDAVRILGI